MADETRTSNDITDVALISAIRWPVSRTTSAWLAAQRQRTPEAHRAWVDEAIRQAQIVGELRAEVQATVATLQVWLNENDIAYVTSRSIGDLMRRLKAALERTA